MFKPDMEQFNDAPLVSVVILTKNGGDIFQQSIQKIFSQRCAFSYEVVVVDSGSTDGTLNFLRDYPIRLFQIKPQDFKFGPTRNFGFSQAFGEYVITLSQDVVPVDGSWLSALVRPLIENKADVVQAKTVVFEGADVFYWVKKGFFYFTRESWKFSKENGNINLSCTNMAIKKFVWEDTGFGDVPMSEDKFLQKKLFAKNYRMMSEPSALAYHGHQYTCSSLIKRCENEGFGWRLLGVRYDFVDMMKDLVQERWVYKILWNGFIQGEIKRCSELFF